MKGPGGNVGLDHPLLVPLPPIRTSDGGSGLCGEPNWGKRWDRHQRFRPEARPKKDGESPLDAYN